MRKFKFSLFDNKNKNDVILAILAGMLLGISFPPISLNLVIFFALIPYFFLIDKRTTLLSISRITYLTMFVFNLITLYWVGSWTKEADPFLMISGGVLLFFNPILFLIPSTLYYLTNKYFRKNVAFLLLPFFWLFYEYIYSITDFRFPWLNIGNALSSNILLMQIADTIGVFGLSLVIIYINISFFFVLKKYLFEKKILYSSLVIGSLLLILLVAYGLVKINSHPVKKGKIKFGIIQPNLNPWNKWEEGNLESLLNVYFNLSKKAVDNGAQILVWPETALPVYLTIGNYDNELLQIKNFLRNNKVYLLTGMPDATIYYNKQNMPEDAKPLSDTSRFYTSYNSILFFNPGNDEIKKYGKQKLVPFGEKVPLVEVIPFIGDLIKWNVGISSWNTGKDTTIFDLTTMDNFRIKLGGVICIESVYADYVAQFVKKGAEILTIVTNDSWYGNSSGPYQHKEYSALRAVENRKYVVRCANGGISCIIDPFGRTIAETKMFEKDFLIGSVYPNNIKTFFTMHPLLLPFLSIVISLFVILYSIYKKIFGKSVNENNRF